MPRVLCRSLVDNSIPFQSCLSFCCHHCESVRLVGGAPGPPVTGRLCKLNRALGIPQPKRIHTRASYLPAMLNGYSTVHGQFTVRELTVFIASAGTAGSFSASSGLYPTIMSAMVPWPSVPTKADVTGGSCNKTSSSRTLVQADCMRRQQDNRAH